MRRLKIKRKKTKNVERREKDRFKGSLDIKYIHMLLPAQSSKGAEGFVKGREPVKGSGAVAVGREEIHQWIPAESVVLRLFSKHWQERKRLSLE